MTTSEQTATAHKFMQLYIEPGDTIESWGYEPEDIIDQEIVDDPRCNGHHRCLEVWVMSETEVKV